MRPWLWVSGNDLSRNSGLNQWPIFVCLSFAVRLRSVCFHTWWNTSDQSPTTLAPKRLNQCSCKHLLKRFTICSHKSLPLCREDSLELSCSSLWLLANGCTTTTSLGQIQHRQALDTVLIDRRSVLLQELQIDTIDPSRIARTFIPQWWLYLNPASSISLRQTSIVMKYELNLPETPWVLYASWTNFRSVIGRVGTIGKTAL